MVAYEMPATKVAICRLVLLFYILFVRGLIIWSEKRNADERTHSWSEIVHTAYGQILSLLNMVYSFLLLRSTTLER